MNLPNALSMGRIAATPLIATLPFANSSALRLTAFVLFLVAAITDYVDGHLARSRQQETDLGRLLDPFADKALLVATLIPMYILAKPHPFQTLWGEAGLPLWIVIVVLGREAFMTVFRQAAARRGVIIAAIRSAKWKTGIQFVWQGAAYCWFWTLSLAAEHDWQNQTLWRAYSLFNGTVGTIVMGVATILTIYSLVIYLRSFGRVFATSPSKLH